MKKLAIISLVLVLTAIAQFTLTVVSVSGTTIDEISGEPVKGQIIIKDEEGKIANRTRSTGKYFATGLKPGKKYIMEISADGYFLKSYDLVLPKTDKYEELSRDFTLKPMKAGVKIPIKVIPFDKGKTKMRDGADYIFKDMIQIMRKNRRSEFEIEVYPEKANEKQFALERANALKNYFSENKIRAALTVKAHEITDPNNPPPVSKRSKGHRYKGSIYLTVKKV
jgi:hypothetical protein